MTAQSTAADVIEIDVAVENPGWAAALPGVEELCRVAATAALSAPMPGERSLRAPAGLELSVILSDDAAVRDLNHRYRGFDKPTNVLSFGQGAPDRPGTGPLLLGDVVIARETVEAEAARDGIAMDDHLAHLVIHGVLHLMGHDHEDDAEAAVMEALETRLMTALGRPDPHGADERN